MLTTTPAAISLIKAWESFKPQAYFDTIGSEWTIGYGTTRYANGDEVAIGDEINDVDAEVEVYHFVRKEIEPALTRHFLGVPLQPNWRDALASLMYNLRNGTNPDRSFPKTKALIHAGAPIEQVADEWVTADKAGGKRVKGLYRRRLAEVLVLLGKPWSTAFDLVQNAGLDTNWRELAGWTTETAHTPQPDPDADMFDEPDIYSDDYDPTPETPLTTPDLNHRERERLAGKKIAMTPITKTVPVEAVEYLADEDKQAGNITVKRIEDSNRGKGYAKTQSAKEIGIAGVGGTAAVAIGAAEPVVSFVEKYPASTIAYVFAGMIGFSVVWYFYGKWQRERGEDRAEDLLG